MTQINAVNQRGLPTKVTDPNGVVTDLAYNQRGWLTSVTKRSAGGGFRVIRGGRDDEDEDDDDSGPRDRPRWLN